MISGLIASTALTLLVIPVTYSLVERLKDRLLGPTTAPAAERPAMPPDAAPGSVLS